MAVLQFMVVNNFVNVQHTPELSTAERHGTRQAAREEDVETSDPEISDKIHQLSHSSAAKRREHQQPGSKKFYFSYFMFEVFFAEVLLDARYRSPMLDH